jgi:hypothetical protein
VKNPSSRPCCFVFRDLTSFSAPLRTRSSLIAHVNMNCMPLRRVDRHSLEPLLLYQEINESFHIWWRPFELQDNELLVTGLQCELSTYFDLVRRCHVRLLKNLFRLLPWPLCGDLNTSPFLLPIVILGRGLLFLRLSIVGMRNEGEAKQKTYFSSRCSTTPFRPPYSRTSFKADFGPMPLIGSR